MVQHDGVQADMVLEKGTGVILLDPKATGGGMRYWVCLGPYLRSTYPGTTEAYFLQQGCTYPNKATSLIAPLSMSFGGSLHPNDHSEHLGKCFSIHPITSFG